jgi:hypothetical protein
MTAIPDLIFIFTIGSVAVPSYFMVAGVRERDVLLTTPASVAEFRWR